MEEEEDEDEDEDDVCSDSRQVGGRVGSTRLRSRREGIVGRRSGKG